MISIERGLEIVAAEAARCIRPDRLPVETVSLGDSVHRILRETVVADADSPPFDKSIRDGFAVRFQDVATVPVSLKVIGESRAGKAAGVSVQQGTCCEIMTGAELPVGANAIVMVEYTERPDASSVRVLRSVREGDGLLRRAAEVRQGEAIMPAGRKIQISDIGSLANAGKATLMVSRKPRVGILGTGDELVDVREIPQSGQIRNSNSHTLSAQVVAAGGSPELLGIARDNKADLREKIGRGLECDILLVSGGVSMGKYDFVEDIFAEYGVRVHFDAVAMKPGKPTVFGTRGETFVFGLPGNPVSTIVAFHMFVRPVIFSLLRAEKTASPVLRARLEEPTRRDPARTAIVPALVRFDDGTYRIRTAPWKGSSDLVGLSRANALIVVPQGEGTLNVDDWADFLPLE